MARTAGDRAVVELDDEVVAVFVLDVVVVALAALSSTACVSGL